MSQVRPLLYVKRGCSWCVEAEEFLRKHGIAYDVVNVSSDREAFRKMMEISGQGLAPTMDWDGEVLADFGERELAVFLRTRGVIP